MRVSAVSMGRRWRGQRGEGSSVTANPCSTATFGSGVLGEEPGQQRPCGSGSALLAVHERWWSEGVELGWCGGNARLGAANL